MTIIVVETRMEAPITLWFDLARNFDAHLRTSASTGERAARLLSRNRSALKGIRT